MDNYDDAGSGYGEVDASIDIDTSGGVEPKPAPAGEHQLLCLKAEKIGGTSKKTGREWSALKLMFDVPNITEAGLVFHTEFLPSKEGSTDKQYAQSLGKFARFKSAMGFADDQPFTISDLVGKEPFAVLSIEHDPEYGEQNRIMRFVASQA